MCSKKSKELGRVGFYFSKFEAPLDNFTSSALLAILESCSPGKLARLGSWRLAGQKDKGVKGPAVGPTRRPTLSSKEYLSWRPRSHRQRPRFYRTSAPHNLPSLLKRVSLSHRLLVFFVTTAHSHAKPLFLESSKIALTLEPFGTFWKKSQTARERALFLKKASIHMNC